MSLSFLERLPDGRELYLSVDEAANKFAILEKVPERLQQSLRSEAAEQRRAYQPGCMIGNTQRHIMPAAEIPTFLLEQWDREIGMDRYDKVARAKHHRAKLNSNEFRDIRTGGGRL